MRLLLAALVVLSVTPGSAQELLTTMGPRCVLPVPAPGQAAEAHPGLRWDPKGGRDAEALLRLPRRSRFEVTYGPGFPAEARAAFEYAAAIWERHVESDAAIRVEAFWSDLGSNFLGSAGPRLLSYAGAAPSGIEPDTWYPYALADAIVGEDIEPLETIVEGGDTTIVPNYDISATFNSGFDRWHFSTTSPAPANRYDFATVVLHELGHGLGFIGTGDVFSDGLEDVGSIGQQGDRGLFPYVYDLFVEDGQGNDVLDEAAYPLDSPELGQLLTGEALFFNGEEATAANGGRRPALYAPADFLAGGSYSHLDEDEFAGGVDALMTPFLGPGERFETPGAVTCGIFSDMGWPLGAGCGSVPPLPVFSARVFPNPSARGGCVALEAGDAGTPGTVAVEVFDVLGRKVVDGTGRASVGDIGLGGCAYTLGSAALAARYNTTLALPTPAAPGVYLVRIRSDDYDASGNDFSQTLRWTVVR